MDPHRDPGRRLRWIIATWFSICVVAMALLSQGVNVEGGWAEPLSDGYHDGGSSDAAISYQTD